GNLRAFRWSNAGKIKDLGTLKSDNTGSSEARGISYDGETVVGMSYLDDNNYHAFKWSDSRGMEDLGTLRADNTGHSEANAISADGRIIVGNAQNNEIKFSPVHAFVWTDMDGMTDLKTLRSDKQGYSSALDISATGDVVVGYSDSDWNSNRAFRWTKSAGMIDLGTFRSDNSGYAVAYG
ncbi:hypothetical protein AI29_16645, partial [bacteria symbiont BFo2 of Frankliniella occidentalis]